MGDSPAENQRARRIVAQKLESLERAGVQQIRKARRPKAADARDALASTANVADVAVSLAAPAIEAKWPASESPGLAAHSIAAKAQVAQAYAQALPGDLNARARLLAEVASEVKGCVLCRELACSRKQTVFGVGSPQARVVFFGEAPGADEDRLGEPFVGRAGQLLTKIIEACGWQRSDVYIMNVLKCRPPENRNPLPQEVENCRPYFERQFEILRPEYIVCVGTFPSQALLETDISVGKLRGRFHQYKGSKVLVTYHPSYLLRNPSAKKYVWEDMQLLLKDMGLPIPKRNTSA
jgi:DNA polymerase